MIGLIWKTCLADFAELTNRISVGDKVEIVGRWHDESPECNVFTNDNELTTG